MLENMGHPVKDRGKGGAEHRYWQRKVQQHYEGKGYDSFIEHFIGRKSIDESDLKAVLELKYIKNYFPVKEWGINSQKILEANDQELENRLDIMENEIEGDLTELKNIPDSVETFFLLFSNNNYLFEEALFKTEIKGKKKIKFGKAAQELLRRNSGDVTIYYTFPENSGHSPEPEGKREPSFSLFAVTAISSLPLAKGLLSMAHRSLRETCFLLVSWAKLHVDHQ